MTRLRRSLRASAPVKLTQEERYEKLISYVMDGNYTENLRQFNMSTYILSEFQSKGSKTRKSTLETLPTDVLLEVVNQLWGIDQIMAALACKTLAAVVEASTIRKIANITYYTLGSKDPSVTHTSNLPCWLSAYKPDPFLWRQWGFGESTLPDSRFHLRCSEQWESLNTAVGKWLGPKYRFCSRCDKFRPLPKTFWRGFAEYENPGITKRSSKESATKVKEVIDLWNETEKQRDSHHNAIICPAHELLRERGGKRVIKSS